MGENTYPNQYVLSGTSLWQPGGIFWMADTGLGRMRGFTQQWRGANSRVGADFAGFTNAFRKSSA